MAFNSVPMSRHRDVIDLCFLFPMLTHPLIASKSCKSSSFNTFIPKRNSHVGP